MIQKLTDLFYEMCLTKKEIREKCLKYLMVMEILIEIFFLFKEDRRTTGHEVTLVNEQHRLITRKL